MKKIMLTFLAFLVFSLVLLPDDAGAEYYGSRTSNKYHYKTCPYFSKIKPSKRIVFKTTEEAAGSGYVPCPVCQPPKSMPAAKDGSAGKPAESAGPAKEIQPLQPAIKSAAKPDEQAVPQEPSGIVPVKIRVIKFEKGVDGMERIAIYLDRFYLPEIRVLEGDRPVIHLDFRNGSLATDKAQDLTTDGDFVRRIRVQKDDTANRLTVILEMEPNQTFFVNPFFYEVDNVYLLEITKVKKASHR